MLQTVCSCTPLTASKSSILMPFDDLMSIYVYCVGNEPLEVLARVSTIDVSYHSLPSYILCPFISVIAFSHVC
jgi:hypothetical protein